MLPSVIVRVDGIQAAVHFIFPYFATAHSYCLISLCNNSSDYRTVCTLDYFLFAGMMIMTMVK